MRPKNTKSLKSGKSNTLRCFKGFKWVRRPYLRKGHQEMTEIVILRTARAKANSLSRSKMVKMRNFWKKRPLTKNYTLLFNTYFYKIKISIFKKLNFGPKGPKMKKQKLHNFANIREHFFQKVQKWPKWPKMTFLTKSDIFWIENNIFFITFM